MATPAKTKRHRSGSTAGPGGRKASPRKRARRRRSRVDTSTLEGHLRRRLDPASDALLAFPVFLTYQAGLLASRSGGSGVDFITSGLVLLCQYSFATYVALLAAMLVGYAALLVGLRRRGAFDPRRFVPMLLEAGVYALAMGSLILFVLRKFVEALPLRAGDAFAGSPLDALVISAGAGFHEELVFRLVLLGGLAWWFGRRTTRGMAVALALVISSLLFAAAHHVGAGSESFTLGAFAYRALAGVYFGVIYVFRGFAVAVWTHALYDLYVLSFTP